MLLVASGINRDSFRVNAVMDSEKEAWELFEPAD